MRYLKYLLGGMLTAALVACGGGGGSAGTTGGGSGGGSVVTPPKPTISVALVDGAGAALAGNSISNSSTSYAKATVLDAAGVGVSNQLVTFSVGDFLIATLAGKASSATVLTDSVGVARVLINPASLTSTGATTLTAAATVNGTGLTSSLNFATSASNVSLANMTLSATSIGALETAAVTVQGLINGSPAASAGVNVSFSASCGSFSPVSATTNSASIASSTYQSTAACSGAVTLTASATGAVDVSRVITLAPAKAANIVFTSATPALIYVSSAASGPKTSIVKFQVLDSSATPMPSQSVVFSLSSASIGAGVKFSLSGTSSTSPQTVSTDASGFASITVASSTLPTPVSVTATLAADNTVVASSLGLVVTTGAATQNSASLSATKLSIEAINTDGQTTSLTMRVADRQGNPVPDGTPVNFVASHGSVTGSCVTATTAGSSGCSVTYTSQGVRPANGRVAILSYLDGEESFVDSPSGTVNVWDSGETFYDVGRLFMDLNENGSWDTGEQQYPGGATGSSICVNPVNIYPSVSATCDGTWSSGIRVRQQTIIALATSSASIERVSPRTTSGFTVWIHDTNANANVNGNNPLGNAMPTGTTVSSTISTTGSNCAIVATSPNIVRNSSSGGLHNIVLNGDPSCTAVQVNVTVTTPGGTSTTQPF